ncbi:MAG: hypothetical protein SGBAC_006360 [Bacillariaceae sp.]
MRFKFKVNLFNEEKSQHHLSDKEKEEMKQSDRKRNDRLIALKKNFQKAQRNRRKPQREARETRYSDRPERYEEREPCENIRRDVTPPRRTSGVVAPRVGSRRDFPALRKNPKHAIQQKLSKKVDARLDALREQLGVEFDHEYGAQKQRVNSIDRQTQGMSFERTRSAPVQRNLQTANAQSVLQRPVAPKSAPAPLLPHRAPSFKGQRQPLFGVNRGSSFTPYLRPPSKMPARAQMTPIGHKKPMQPSKRRSSRPVKTRSEKKIRNEAAPDASEYGILDAMFSGMCAADAGCGNAQSGCNNAQSGCTVMQAGCTSSAKKWADKSCFDEEETLWTQSETLSDDGQTIGSRTKTYIGEHESDVSDSDFDDESSWGDATSYQSEDDTHHHDRKHRASRKTDKRKQDDRPSRGKAGPEKHENKSRRVYDDETFARSDGESCYTENRTEVDTYYHSEYDAESQWTDGETYFTRETRPSRKQEHDARRRRDSDSDLTDSESDYSSYDSGDSYDTRTYTDSTWRTKGVDDDTFYDDETMYTEVKKRTKTKGNRR